MAYVAIKPCSLGGQRFRIGDEVPADVIQPGAANNLVKMGIIADQDGEKTSVSTGGTITITLHVEDEDMPLDVTNGGIQAVFDALTANATNAIKIVQEMEDAEALILLDVVESRKSVKEELRKRAQALTESGANEGEL